MRAAFTLVELLVAIVVLTIGLLALAGAAGLVAAHLADGGRLSAGAHAVRSLMDSLATVPCDALTGARSTTDGVELSWTVVRDSTAASIELSAVSPLRRAARADMYRALVPCARE